MRRKKRYVDESVAVDMSPLIDCVFLLLIFFLVTTTLKIKENYISLKLPNESASINQVTQDDFLILAIDKKGEIFSAKKQRKSELKEFDKITDLEVFLKDISDKAKPIRLEVSKDLPFQETVATLDTLKTQGFNNVALKVKGD